MEHLKFLKKIIGECSDLANSLWLKQLKLSDVSIWDQIKVGVVVAAIVTRDDKEINEDDIVNLAVADVTGDDSFIVDAIFGIELSDIVMQVRNTNNSNQTSFELQMLSWALFEPVITSLHIGWEGLDDESKKVFEKYARDIYGSASVAAIFYKAAKKIN